MPVLHVAVEVIQFTDGTPSALTSVFNLFPDVGEKFKSSAIATAVLQATRSAIGSAFMGSSPHFAQGIPYTKLSGLC